MTDIVNPDDDTIGPPPGDEDNPHYRPIAPIRSGKAGAGFIWFACRDGNRDRVLPLATLRDIEPGAITGTTATLHFSGMDVLLEGANLRQVIYRIFLGRAASVHEIRPGQTPIRPEDGIVQHIRFPVPPVPDARSQKPRHEPETAGRAKAKP